MPVTDAEAIEDVADTLFNAIEQTDIAMIRAVVERRRRGVALR